MVIFQKHFWRIFSISENIWPCLFLTTTSTTSWFHQQVELFCFLRLGYRFYDNFDKHLHLKTPVFNRFLTRSVLSSFKAKTSKRNNTYAKKKEKSQYKKVKSEKKMNSKSNKKSTCVSLKRDWLQLVQQLGWWRGLQSKFGVVENRLQYWKKKLDTNNDDGFAKSRRLN